MTIENRIKPKNKFLSHGQRNNIVPQNADIKIENHISYFFVLFFLMNLRSIIVHF